MSRSRSAAAADAFVEAPGRNPIGHFPALRKPISTPGPSCATVSKQTPSWLCANWRSLTSHQSPAHAATDASRPSLAFHGNIQAAVAEARNLVEQGYRVVFFARSIGELERLADIFQEYSVPFQLGLDPADATRPYLAERSYIAGAVPPARSWSKGWSGAAWCFPKRSIAVFGSEDLFDSSDLVAKPRTSEVAARGLHRRPGRSRSPATTWST